MKDAYVYLRHIADALARIGDYVPKDRQAFFDDTQCQDAVMRNLAVIGEAVKNCRPRSAHDIWKCCGRILPACATFSFMTMYLWMLRSFGTPFQRPSYFTLCGPSAAR